ncbi:MAG TPA: hypothetical protein VHE83_07770 [Mycobacteriales bacterium]|nr:hypothetical protein [Mycobacteriales bacterium]
MEATIDRPAGQHTDWRDVVAAMWADGSSAHTIAAALNRSGWAASDGKQWHWRQVAAIVSPPTDVRRVVRVVPEPSVVDRHREELRRALDAQSPSADLATRIALHVQAGDSAGTIAARLNASGSRTAHGTRWTARAIEALLRPGGAYPVSVPPQLRAG